MFEIMIAIDQTKRMGRLFLMALLMAVVGTSTLYAQDDQAHKKAFNEGLEAYRTYKDSRSASDLSAAIDAFTRSAQLAGQNNDSDVQGKARQYASRMLYTQGNTQFKAGQFQAALASYNQSLEFDPNYEKVNYQMGLAHKRMGNSEEALTNFEAAMSSSDTRTRRAAEQAVRNYFFEQIADLFNDDLTSSGADQVIATLTEMQDHVEADDEAMYRLGQAYHAKGDYAQAIAMADQALSTSRGSNSTKAAYYFLKGEALMRSGDATSACDAFRNATFGSLRASAQYQLDNNCGGTN